MAWEVDRAGGLGAHVPSFRVAKGAGPGWLGCERTQLVLVVGCLARWMPRPRLSNVTQVFVVGAGIGGLAAAVGLTRSGMTATVAERAERPGPVGAGLTIQPNAVIALDRLGVGEAVRAVATQLRGVQICTRDGRVLAELDAADAAELQDELGAPALGIHRATLHEVLVESLPPGTVEFARTVVGVVPGPDAVDVQFADGTTDSSDVVIGADGLHSRVRAALLGAGAPRYAGYFCWRGVTEWSAFPPGWSGEFWGPARRFGGCAIDGDRFYWFAVAAGPAGGSDPHGAHAAVTATFADFAAVVRKTIAKTEPEAVFRTDISDRPPVSTWGSGRVTLLGDAAHAMTPNLGQGACHAIEDALVLATHVGRLGPTTEALRAYEAQRIPRANTTVRTARRMGSIAQWSGPRAEARNALLRATPRRVLRRQLAAAWTLPY